MQIEALTRSIANSPVVLLVDDSPEDREHYVRSLKRVSDVEYSYLEASGGDSMMDHLGKSRPDCVLLDYSLPGRNGLDLLRQMVTDFPFLPVIMLTGQGNENIAVQSIKLGAQHYLVKSEITPGLLHETIMAAIKHSALARDHDVLVQKLMAANTELERFAYVASHDLQEPIRMVCSFSRILSEEYNQCLDDAGREYLAFVHQSSVRMHDMVADLLTYSRMGGDSGQHVWFDGEGVLQTALDNLRELIRECGAKVSIDTMPDLFGNPVQLVRLLQNLITNAIKYQPTGNLPVIHIGLTDHPEFWQISVSDNGLGIDPRFVEQIFQPFRRLHVWDNIQGTGLGLSICKRIANSHGGDIWATSEEGKGSIFYITLAKRCAI